MSTQKDIEEMAEYFSYLDELRESGVTNMFGAGFFLQEHFEMTKANSHKVLSAWMQSFGNGKETVEARAKLACALVNNGKLETERNIARVELESWKKQAQAEVSYSHGVDKEIETERARSAKLVEALKLFAADDWVDVTPETARKALAEYSAQETK